MSDPVETISVLLLEDNPIDARLVIAQLEAATQPSFKVEHVIRLEDALRRLAASQPDLVLSDLNLPDSSGVDTIRRLTAAAPRTPVVSLTATSDERTSEETMRIGAEDYFVKGEGSPRMLRRILRNAIERKRLNNQLQDALVKVRTLQGLLPICAWCKKIRTDDGYYEEIEHYIADHSDLTFTHGICPTCAVKLRERKPAK